SLLFFDQFLDVVGNGWTEAFDDSHAFLDATPGTVGLPGAVQHLLCRLGEVFTPVMGDGGQLCIGAEFLHVGMVSNRVFAFFLGSLHSGGGVGVVRDDVGTLASKGQGGVALFARVEPAIDPDYAYFGIGIDAAHATGKGVDALQDFGYGECAYIAGNV